MMQRRMPAPPMQEDDIEDNQWRRKSYALAQQNELPLPMPLPIGPPPRPCPPPANPVIVRGRVRPPYPGQGYRPAGYRPSRMPRPTMNDPLPTLSEGGSACPTPDMAQRRGVPLPVSPPMAPHTPTQPRISSPQEYSSSPLNVTPEKTRITPLQDPYCVSPLTHPMQNKTNIPAPTQNYPFSPANQENPKITTQENPSFQDTFSVPPSQKHPTPSAHPEEPPKITSFRDPYPVTPTPENIKISSPQKYPTPPVGLHKDILKFTSFQDPVPVSNFPPQPQPPETRRNSIPMQESPVAPASVQPSMYSDPTPSYLDSTPVIADSKPTYSDSTPTFSSFQSPKNVPRSGTPRQGVNSAPIYAQPYNTNPQLPPQPIRQAPQSTTIEPLKPTRPSPPIPQPQLPQPTTTPQTQPQPSPSITHSSPQKHPPPLPSNPPPTHRGPKPGRKGVPQAPPSPRPSIPPPAVPIKPPPSPKTQQSILAPKPRDAIPNVTSTMERSEPEMNNPRVQNMLPDQNRGHMKEHKPRDEENEQSIADPPRESIMVTPNSDMTTIESKPSSPTISQDLPPTPTSQDLPPSPSFSRSSTPTSLGRPRTPTSIRAAPSWQPVFSSTTPMDSEVPRSPQPVSPPKTPTTVTSESEGPNLSPVTTLRAPMQQLAPNNQVFPPTPPSSLSHAGQENCTPYSSFNSLNHGPSKTSMGEEEVHHVPDGDVTAETGPDTEKDLPYPAVLDAKSLHTQSGKGHTNPAMIEAPHDTISSISQDTYQTYRTRFWVLALFSLIGFLQTIVWGTFGPIAESALAAFPSWTDSTIAAFPSWGPIVVVTFTIPMMWFVQKLGLRLGMIICTVLLTLGTMLRCFTSNETPFTILCHVAAILFAFSACLVLSFPPMVAAIWFPPSERITATAVGTLMCSLGGAAMYLGSLMVQYPSSENPSEQERIDIRSDIMTLMYTHFAGAAVLLIAVCIYFPAKPPTPPSASSAIERTDYFSGVKGVVKNRPLLLVLAVFAFSYGVPIVWIGVLNLSLLEIGIHQEQAMGVAVVAVVCSCIASFITARITDRMYGHLRVTSMVLLGLSSCFFLWFLLLSTKVIATDLAQVYVSVAGGLCFEYATVPLLVDLAVELGYPIPESVTGATLTFVFNVVALVFLGLFQIPNTGNVWVSYVLFACVSLTLLPLFFVKETHKRSDTDRKYINHDT